MPSQIEAAYMAGIMDGEGTFSITKIRQNRVYKNGERSKKFAYQLHINAYNSSKKLIDWVVKNIGGTLYTSKEDLKNPKWKRKHMVFFGNRESMESLINLILPYLVIKKEQALVALRFLNLHDLPRPQEREELRLEMLRLNDSWQRPKYSKSVTTNTPDISNDMKIESELCGDVQSGPGVIQETDYL